MPQIPSVSQVSLKFLLPHKFKFMGLVLFILGLILAYFRFSVGVKPEIMTIPVFAIYSSFLETKTFQFITNNVSEEIVIIFLLLGLAFLNFSKEKEETQLVNHFRFKAFIYSVAANIFFLILCTLFIYGFAYLNVLMVNIFSQLILYQVIFRFLIFAKKNGTF